MSDSALRPVCEARLKKSGDEDAPPRSQRLAKDFCLEERVRQPSGECSWVAVLPWNGSPGSGLSWPRFLFLHVHAGPFGGHKNLRATVFNAKRLVTFKGLDAQFEQWVEACWVCICFRKQTTKIQSGFFQPRHRLPFHHVMVDVEGRITPADSDGSSYVLTWICVTTGAPLFEPMQSTRHSCLRRAAFRCAARAKTWPMLVASDRGKEFANQLMEELWSLLNVNQRLGSSWRPVEQSLVERSHKEEQKEIGIFLHSVFECAPGHWAELLPLAEFVIWNTPGKTGLSLTVPKGYPSRHLA